jgi:hypothetical protein
VQQQRLLTKPENKMTVKMATLINAQGNHFDRLESTSMKTIKEWAKGRGGCYTLDVDSVFNIMNGTDDSLQFAVKNNRFYKIN